VHHSHSSTGQQLLIAGILVLFLFLLLVITHVAG
jgi:hypothetical protein